jgi:lysophospholipase L1-like esterase
VNHNHPFRFTIRRLVAAGTLACLAITVAAVPKHRKRAKPVHVKLGPRTVAGIANAQTLEPFFDALRDLESNGSDRIVRVMQFGDSHTAADFWSGRMRWRLQSRFGNGGFGLIMPARPWRGYHHDGVDQLEGRGWPGTSLREKETDGLVGFAGAALFPPASGVFRLRAAFGEYRVQILGEDHDMPRANVVEVTDPAALPTIAAPSLTVGPPGVISEDKPIEGLGNLKTFGESGLPYTTPQELSITFPAGSRLLGVDLRSGHSGVIYDELGLNGAEMTDLDRWNVALRQALFASTKPDLIVLAYGTNDMDRQEPDPMAYQMQVQALMTKLKQESGAAILVVGPMDRIGTKRRQAARLRVEATRTIHALRAAALASGCAFWDARQAMGGEGSMLKWRRAGLAKPDLVHLTVPGYERIGNDMADALIAAFDQMGKDRESE